MWRGSLHHWYNQGFFFLYNHRMIKNAKMLSWLSWLQSKECYVVWIFRDKCLVALTETVVSANTIDITLTLNLPLLSQLWQRVLCPHCMYSQMLYPSSHKMERSWHDFSNKTPLKSHLKLFLFIWVWVKHIKKILLFIILARVRWKDQYHSQVCTIRM